MPQPAKEEPRLDIVREGNDFDLGLAALHRRGEPAKVRPVEPHPFNLVGSDLVEDRVNAGRVDSIDLAAQRPDRSPKPHRWQWCEAADRQCRPE